MVIKGYNYPDTCLISRSEGKTDGNGKEVLSKVYAGYCELQYSTKGDTGFKGGGLQSSPMLIIPDNNIIFKSNDKIVVTTGVNGRVQSFTIEQWEAISDEDFPELNDTEIWLKGGVDV